MVYGFVHSDTVAPMLVSVVKNARQVYRFEALVIEIVSQFSGISLTSAAGDSKRSLWESVKTVAKQRNEVLHGDGLLKVTRDQAEEALAVATTLLETVFPALLTTLGARRAKFAKSEGDHLRRRYPLREIVTFELPKLLLLSSPTSISSGIF
jgi:hypothetical protein